MIPSNRIATHPGVILLKEFLEPLELTQKALATHVGVPVQRVNEIVRGKRGVTPETAWLLSKALRTTPEFSNYYVESDNFISNNRHFCKSALNRYTQWDFIAMVEKHGIEYEERKHSQLFCLHSAGDILKMLLKECEQTGVEIFTDSEVSSVKDIYSASEHGSYQVNIFQGKGGRKNSFKLNCDSLVVATGALSIPTLGGSGAGYDIAQQFGLPLRKRRAGLVPFMFSDALKPVCERLSGLATEVEISCNGQSFTESMLFTHRGISGPAILQISNYWYPGDVISIDLLPGTEATSWLLEQKISQAKVLLKNVLSQKFARALVAELQALWWPEFGDTAMAEFSDNKLTAIGTKINDWQLKPSATEGYRTAEVTLGGVDTDGISSKTMEAKQQPGLYFVGEVLDVTGHLGGFNFQWAWSSGYSAGLFA